MCRTICTFRAIVIIAVKLERRKLTLSRNQCEIDARIYRGWGRGRGRKKKKNWNTSACNGEPRDIKSLSFVLAIIKLVEGPLGSFQFVVWTSVLEPAVRIVESSISLTDKVSAECWQWHSNERKRGHFRFFVAGFWPTIETSLVFEIRISIWNPGRYLDCFAAKETMKYIREK